MRLREAAVAYF